MSRFTKKLKKKILASVIAPAALLFAACGSESVPTLKIIMNRGQIAQILYHGMPIFKGTAGYSLIGGCIGADDENNLASYLDEGDGMMSSDTGVCQKIPYVLEARVEGNQLFTHVSVGPIPKPVNGRPYVVSVPFEPDKNLFESFEFGNVKKYEVGCGNAYDVRIGNAGLFKELPTPCILKDLGTVGLARAENASYIETKGSGIKIKRETFVRAGCVEYSMAYNHPATNNTEIDFCDHGSDYHEIDEVFTFSDDIPDVD